jgi:hypothetical protein
MRTETISQYAIYDHPRDFPAHFVKLLLETEKPTVVARPVGSLTFRRRARLAVPLQNTLFVKNSSKFF